MIHTIEKAFFFFHFSNEDFKNSGISEKGDQLKLNIIMKKDARISLVIFLSKIVS